ncbi:MAG: immunity 51 family protein [Xanthomonadales bacterium]|nr:immunity 51 family protein [Xanthomonadales bacterium]
MVHPEYHKVSVFVFNEADELLLLGDKLHARFNEAHMSGHNWDALIRRYLDVTDPDLMQSIETDPESGMLEAYMPYGPESIEKMTRFESHVRKFVSDETQIFEFIEAYRGSIEWD